MSGNQGGGDPPAYTGIDPAESVATVGPIVTVDVAGAFMQLPNPDTDPLLAIAVATGNASAASWLGWDPRSMQTIETIDATGSRTLKVTRKKITAVASIIQTPPGCAPAPLNLNGVSWDQREGLITLVCAPWRGRNQLQVTYTAGYAAVPGDLVQGFLYCIKASYDAAGVDQNAEGESFSGVLSQQFHAGGAGFVPPAAQSLMARYRRSM